MREVHTWIWNSDAYEAARRCIVAAYTERDPETRRSLARAARKYIRKAHGLEERAPAGMAIAAGAVGRVGL